MRHYIAPGFGATEPYSGDPSRPDFPAEPKRAGLAVATDVHGRLVAAPPKTVFDRSTGRIVPAAGRRAARPSRLWS